MKHVASRAWLGIFFDREDGGVMFLRKVGRLSADYTPEDITSGIINLKFHGHSVSEEELQPLNVIFRSARNVHITVSLSRI
jgi:hypothetical protein